MGFLQLIIIFTIFVVGKNYLFTKNKEKSTILGTVIEIIAITLFVMTLEYFFPFFK